MKDYMSEIGLRQSAKIALDERIKRTEKYLDGLKKLKLEINWDKLNPETDGVLWEMFVRPRY